MSEEKKQDNPSLEEQVKLHLKLDKEGRLPLGADYIQASYPQPSKQQKKN